MRALLLAAFTLALFAHTPAAFAAEATGEELSPAALVAEQRRYDGETVTLTGEAIGEALRAEDGTVWVNVLGDGVLLGVIVDRDDAAKIGMYGNYKQRGDEVRITGPFQISCDVHSGETDVHATEFEIVRTGETVDHPVSWPRAAGGLLALALTAGLGILYRRREHAAPSSH